MAWFVYLARCADDTLYCGIAKDVAARIAAHDAGTGAKYTRTRGPLRVIYQHRCRDQGGALRLEYRIKQLSRAQKLLLAARAGRAGGAAKPARARAPARTSARTAGS